MYGIIVKAYRDGNDIIFYVRQNKNTKVKVRVRGFKPYFYAHDNRGQYVSIFGERVRKIIAPSPDKVPILRQYYSKHYEADIPYVRRFMIDKRIYSGILFPDNKDVVNVDEVQPTPTITYPRIIILDIEVLATTMPNKDNPIHPVIAWTIWDSYSNKYYTAIFKEGLNKVVKENKRWRISLFSDESDLLYELIILLNKLEPDIITGWNIDFDVDYLRARCEYLKIPFELEGVEIFDYLMAYRHLFKASDYRLKHIAVVESIRKKEELIDAQEAIRRYRSGDLKRFIKYNWDDVDIIKQLEDKHKIIDFYLRLKWAVGLESLEKTFHSSVLIDTMALRLAKKNGYVLPSISEEVKDRRYVGAIVFQPPTGIIEDVAEYDMSRYYPSLIISFNLSPETKSNKGICIDTGNKKLYFKPKPLGLIPQICQKFLLQRELIERELDKLTPGTKKYEDLLNMRNVY